jgi:hypothetical protein
MQYFENTTKRYFHGSRFQLPVGFKITPQKNGYTSHPETQKAERLLEKYRPTNKLSRSQSVFLVDDPELIDFAGGYEDYIYEVQPVGKVEKSDLSWYSEIESIPSGGIYLDSYEEEIKQCALNYWNDVPYYKPENSLFEYRTPAAIIIGQIMS